MTDHPGCTELELHAFIDGELSPVRHAEVAAAIHRDPELRRRLAELRELDAAVRSLAVPLLELPVPARLTRAALHPPADRVQRGGRPRWKAAAVAWALAASVAAGVFVARDRGLRDIAPDAVADPLVADALAARDGDRAPLRQVSFASGADAGAGDRFVSGALGPTMRAPDLRRAGFTLAAADLYDGPKGRAVQLRYRDRDRHLFAVYIRPGAGPDRFALLRHRAVGICVWQNEDMGAVMSAELPNSELFRLSSMTYSALAL